MSAPVSCDGEMAHRKWHTQIVCSKVMVGIMAVNSLSLSCCEGFRVPSIE